MHNTKKKITWLFVFVCCFSPAGLLLKAQTLASNHTRAQARYNKDKLFADAQRKIFTITSWAGATMADLSARWGNFTKKSELPDGTTVYSFEYRYSGNGGTYTPGYTVTDQFGNIAAQKAAKDNTYSYNFADYYDFYVDSTKIIIHVKTGTR